MKKVNIKEKLDLFSEHWKPKIIGELNGQLVKISKLQGEFIWHHHEQEDELFLVIKGHLTIKLRDEDIELDEGEFFIVQKGVEHKPVSTEEVHLMMFEPASTLNTGNVQDERTQDELEVI